MDLNNFTEKSREALTEAQNIGTRLQHQAVDVEHLMLALLEQKGGLVRSLFEKAKVAPDLLETKVEEELGRMPRVSGDTTTGQVSMSCHCDTFAMFGNGAGRLKARSSSAKSCRENGPRVSDGGASSVSCCDGSARVGEYHRARAELPEYAAPCSA